VNTSRHALAAGCLVFALAIPSAHADDEPAFVIGSTPSWMLLGGVTTGGTIALGDKGALVGGELSLARLQNATFMGFYADGYYDWGANGTYVTGGIEIGHKFLGLDGGVAMRFADGDRDVGFTGRLTFGIGLFGIFGRFAHFEHAMTNDNVIQIGLVLKLPLWARGGY
jgi:hypothetical protein